MAWEMHLCDYIHKYIPTYANNIHKYVHTYVCIALSCLPSCT